MAGENITVSIGANATGFTNAMSQMQGSLSSMQNATNNFSQRMRDAMNRQRQALEPLRAQMRDVNDGWLDIAEGASTYSGTTDQFIADLTAQGNAQRAVTDQMVAGNQMGLQSFYQMVGGMLARSGQSDKIASNFSRMGNPLYTVNNGLLRVTSGMEGMARAGQPAVLALRLLGPTANMKKLQDMTMMITQGLMRFQMVAMAGAVATGVMVGALHKASMENEGYKKSFEGMMANIKKMFQPMVDLFSQIMPYVYNFISAIAKMVIQFNEAHPFIAKIIAGFMMLIPLLVLILSPLAIGIGLFAGLQAAFASVWLLIGPLVTGLGAMGGTVLLVAGIIVGLIAVGVLLYKNWDTIVKWLSTAWSAIKNTAVSVWNGIKDFFVQWGTTILAVLTGPIGILVLLISRNWDTIKQTTANVWNAIKSALASAWEAIKGVFTSAIDGVKSIAQTLVTFFLNYTPLGWVIKTLIANWDAIKNLFKISGEMIKGIWTVCWNAISNFMNPILTKIKTAITTAWNAIKTATSTAFNAVKGVASTVWNAIKTAISTVANAIKGVVSTAWNAVKSTTSTIFNGVKSTATTIFNQIKSAITGVVNGIKGAVSSAFNAVKTAMTKPINEAKGIISSALNAIKGFFSNLKLTIPKPKIPKINVTAGSKTVAGVKIPFPKIDVSWFKTGGVFNGASVIGVGEAGPEAVVPLQGHRMKPFADAIAGEMPKGAGGGNGQPTIVSIQLDGREIARATAQHMEGEIRGNRDSKTRARGGF